MCVSVTPGGLRHGGRESGVIGGDLGVVGFGGFKGRRDLTAPGDLRHA